MLHHHSASFHPSPSTSTPSSTTSSSPSFSSLHFCSASPPPSSALTANIANADANVINKEDQIGEGVAFTDGTQGEQDCKEHGDAHRNADSNVQRMAVDDDCGMVAFGAASRPVAPRMDDLLILNDESPRRTQQLSPPSLITLEQPTSFLNGSQKRAAKSKAPELTLAFRAHQNSDEDSVCADIDRWAGSSLGEDETSRGSSRMEGSAWVRELEEEKERMSESMLALSTQFAQIQFRIQQIVQAPSEQRDGMLQQLQQFSSRSCLDFGHIKSTIKKPSIVDENGGDRLGKGGDGDGENDGSKEGRAQQVRQLIGELRAQLRDLEQFAWKNGELAPDELPMDELRARQRLVLERLREKMRLQVQLAGPETDKDEEQFRRKLDESLEQALEPIREKDQLVRQLRTQIVDLERYVQLLQQEVLAATSSPPGSPNKVPPPGEPPFHPPLPLNANGIQNSPGLLLRLFGCGNNRKSVRHFERNELKHTPLGNHYGDQRAEMELAADELVQVMRKNQILSVNREDRGELSVEELDKVILEGGQEAILSFVRKRFCPTIRALLEHGMRPTVAPMPRQNSLLAGIGCFGQGSQQLKNSRFLRPADLAKFEGRKLDHIWDVLTLFLDASRALEMRDAVVGQLSDAFKLESVAGKSATSKQILLSTIEHINNSHARLRRSQDSMWKAFVCAALNRNRLPAWIRIIFRSEMVLSRCYHTWSYVARTGVEDIRPLLEGLHQFNFDLPVDLAVRPFEHIKEAFG